MQEIVDTAEAAGRNLSAEETANFNAADAELNEITARIERLERMETTRADVNTTQNSASARFTGLPEDSQRTSTTVQDAAERQADHQRLITNYLRYGTQEMDPQDRAGLRQYFAALQTVSGGGGGYTIAPQWRNEIVEAMKAYGGMRQAATVITTDSGADLPFVTNDDTGNVGELLSESGTASEQDTSFGQRVLKAYMYDSKVVRVSFQLLQDSAFDLPGYLTSLFATRLGRITNTHYTTGTGGNMPNGIIQDATSGVTAAGQTAVTYDELIDLVHSVDPSYRNMPGVGFMFNDTTLRSLRKLKDGEGRYLWSSGTQLGAPDRIAEYPYIINQDLATMATTTKSILFGGLGSYYIRDTSDMMVLRLEELYALQAQVAFVAFMRTDGALIDAGTHPVKYITMA
jgi:HK97 family phage major capsid protein